MMPQQHKIEGRPTLHRAGWVLMDSQTVLQNGYLTTVDGRIEKVGNGIPPRMGDVIDHGPGVLLPPLVNAHTHLELCALTNQVPMAPGFVPWAKELIALRESLSPNILANGITQGIEQLVGSGTLIVGDISSVGLSWDILKRSPLAGVLFKEFLGTDLPDGYKLETSGGFSQSFAGHAPHTTAPKLLRALVSESRHTPKPFSIHLAESDEETEFITTGRGRWAAFLTQRGILFDDWPLPAKSPVEYLHTLNLLKPGLLAVHLLQCDSGDFELLAKQNVAVCLCVQSNINLHGKKPDLKGMIKAGLKIGLGTDSLASCDSLSIFTELAALSSHYPGIAPETLFKMATLNGSAALGLAHDYGTLSKGKQALMIYLPMTPKNPKTLIERLVNSPDAAPNVIDARKAP